MRYIIIQPIVIKLSLSCAHAAASHMDSCMLRDLSIALFVYTPDGKAKNIEYPNALQQIKHKGKQTLLPVALQRLPRTARI